jgi:hypothetical protein
MTTKWANIEDEAAPHALLRRVSAYVPITAIDSIWIFPTRRSGAIESTVLVLSTFDGDGDERRRVGAIRFLVTRDRKGRATIEDQIHEYASAPTGAIQRVVDGVMRRLGDEAADPPRPHAIEGDLDNWRALLRELGGSDVVDDTPETEPAAFNAETGAPTDTANHEPALPVDPAGAAS